MHNCYTESDVAELQTIEGVWTKYQRISRPVIGPSIYFKFRPGQDTKFLVSYYGNPFIPFEIVVGRNRHQAMALDCYLSLGDSKKISVSCKHEADDPDNPNFKATFETLPNGDVQYVNEYGVAVVFRRV
jgi:hypothetical protein